MTRWLPEIILYLSHSVILWEVNWLVSIVSEYSKQQCLSTCWSCSIVILLHFTGHLTFWFFPFFHLSISFSLHFFLCAHHFLFLSVSYLFFFFIGMCLLSCSECGRACGSPLIKNLKASSCERPVPSLQISFLTEKASGLVALGIKVLFQPHWKLVTEFNDFKYRINSSQKSEREWYSIAVSLQKPKLI